MISQATGATIGAGKTNAASGHISLASITAATITAVNEGPTSGSIDSGNTVVWSRDDDPVDGNGYVVERGGN